MSLWTLLIRELAHRRLNALIIMAGVAGASGLLVGVLVSLEVHAKRSEAVVRRHEAVTQSEMEALREEVRGAMQRLGYNAILLPKDQFLGDWYAEDYASKTMPEACSSQLKKTKELADRYLPRLRQKIKWPEKKWTVIVVGVGEETILDTSVGSNEPLVTVISPKSCVVGYELHQSLGLRPGQTITIRGMNFEVESGAAESGTKDDITLRMNLLDAQQLVGLPDAINEILLVEHLSVWGRSEEVRRRVSVVLPDCQVVEMASETMSRAHARVKVSEEAEAAIAQERQRRVLLRAERDRVVKTFVPLSGLVTAIWVAMLMYLNVRDRAPEIGILMAQGCRTRWVQVLFFSKSGLLGFFGGIAGFVSGSAMALLWERAPVAASPNFAFYGVCLGLAVAMSVGACLLGTWFPAWVAVKTDVAVVLRQE